MVKCLTGKSKTYGVCSKSYPKMQWSIVIFQSFHMAISCEKPNCHLGCAIQEASKKNTYMIYIYIYDLYIGVSIVIELPNSWMKKNSGQFQSKMDDKSGYPYNLGNLTSRSRWVERIPWGKRFTIDVDKPRGNHIGR